jgi:DNA-binding response OmpR family regulator
VTTILLVDDEAAITDNLAPFLKRAGFSVVVASTGEEALARLPAVSPDLVVLTQVGESGERTMALEEGADDYLNKPFDPYELVARIRAVLRRGGRNDPSLRGAQRLRSGDVVLDRASQRVFKADREVALTPRATVLLGYLMSHPDEVLTRERLLEAVWGWSYQSSTRSVDTRVAELRRALERDSGAPELITTVPGLGYRFSARVESV